MILKISAATKRIAASSAIALPMTIALLFLMTRPILPGEQDRIVTNMIRNIELQRVIRPLDPIGIQVFERPPPVETKTVTDVSGQAKIQGEISAQSAFDDGPTHVIDWWTEARRVVQESDEESLKRWLMEQGYERYTTIMQGPVPITNSVWATLPATQEDATGYMNTFGDMELKISENCVIQTQVSARLDISDFARNLPMRVMCKTGRKIKYSFDRDEP